MHDMNLKNRTDYSVAGALFLWGENMTDWFEISLSIFLWMSLSFAAINVGVSLVSLVTLRKHPYVFLFLIPLFVMMIIVAFLFGMPTSMIFAFAMSASKNEVSTWHCMVMGLIQTILICFISWSRLLATM